jgi:hypothetical protein
VKTFGSRSSALLRRVTAFDQRFLAPLLCFVFPESIAISSSVTLKILDLTFVFFSGLACSEGSEIPAVTGLRIALARIETVFA